MMKIYGYLILALILVAGSSGLYAQSGMKFPELEKRLQPYFADELINDVKETLAQGGDYTIWGWDVGDYSDDSFNDVALSVKYSGDKKKVTQIFLFVDIDGYLKNVDQFPLDYFEMPLENGISIRRGTCFVTKKFRQFDWAIKGYRFINGSVLLYDDFNTSKVDKYTHESYNNYVSLQNTERYLFTNNGKNKFRADYLKIPSYQRGRQVFQGYTSEITCDKIEYVPKGAYYWKGEDDASFVVRSAYDNDNLFMTVDIKDDELIVDRCDNCPYDYLELWIDVNQTPPNSDRFMRKAGDKMLFPDKAESGIYNIKFHPGDFLGKKAFVKEVNSTDRMEYYQKQAVKKIKVVSTLREHGYELKFKIPFEVFGFKQAPVSEDKITELGCSVILHDIDNEFRPEEETIISNSIIDISNPSTYGSLLLIPNNKWYGEAKNIYTDDIIKQLQEFGF